jgi:DNA polymerase-3 subunit gamma/tau
MSSGMNGTNTEIAEGRAGAYRVLARKYRPRTFEDLIGQEPMVRTLTNAFDSGRIAQAYMLTGVRGVGKTTTARILARALNYSVPGKVDKPTVHMPALGEHCAAIMEGRHVDVIEMDAASHTGIDDIREITEAARYYPTLARYKIYIIDEVHMLSSQAFNGLLKTLEEPPEHVKFIFATTEIRKVPVTVLSRCQRFDLRRIDSEKLIGLLRSITEKEKIDIEDQALALIARAAEGSARDALSLLDQAAAHSAAAVTAEDVRGMLGLADRARVIDLFAALMRGDVAAALAELADQYNVGADPAVVLQDLAVFTHLVTRLKIAPSAAEDATLTPEERERARAFAGELSMRVLSRAWQMLLKGIAEVQEAGHPLAAADMVLVRIAYAADLPTTDEALRQLRDNAGLAPPRSSPAPADKIGARGSSGASPARATQPAIRSEPAPQIEARPNPRLETFEDLVAHAGAERELKLKVALERNVRLIRFEPGRIEMELTGDAPAALAGDLGRKLQEWTGQRWVISIGSGKGGRTLDETRAENRARMVTDARSDPLVAEVLARFPGAEIVDVRVTGAEPPPFAPPEDFPEAPDEAVAGDDE